MTERSYDPPRDGEYVDVRLAQEMLEWLIIGQTQGVTSVSTDVLIAEFADWAEEGEAAVHAAIVFILDAASIIRAGDPVR